VVRKGSAFEAHLLASDPTDFLPPLSVLVDTA
jgi:hypothetical protein